MNKHSQDIDELEMKIMFQEDLIERLNQSLGEQQQQLCELQFQMKHVLAKIKAMSISQVASEEQETPPPHY